TREEAGDRPIQIALRDFVVFIVVRGDAIGDHDNVIVSLIGIDGGCPDTCVGVHPSDDQALGPKSLKQVIELRAEESTVALLYDHGLRWIPIKLRQDLASFSPRDRDPQVALSHHKKSVAEIRRELLPNPDDGLPVRSKSSSGPVDRLD